MKQRIISGIILVAILIPTLLIGGYFTGIILGIVSLMGIYELLKVFKLEKSVPAIITYVVDILYYAVLICLSETGNFPYSSLFTGISDASAVNQNSVFASIFLFLLLLFFVTLMLAYVILFPKYKAMEIMSCLFIFIYAGVLLSCVYRIRSLDTGIYLVWIIFIASWICDTCAYFSGVFLGKHKAFPVLSPKKTWEGCIGGVIGSVLVAFLYAVILNDKIYDTFNFPYIALPIIAFVCSILSMFGDLAASAIKRDYKIKDYSSLIPGHGGIMDRFDSVIFVAPAVYYMILFFQ
ncbi:MAG: phosphatidate cytidylyltransferase [Lachnospiraceae bacterium]